MWDIPDPAEGEERAGAGAGRKKKEKNRDLQGLEGAVSRGAKWRKVTVEKERMEKWKVEEEENYK